MYGLGARAGPAPGFDFGRGSGRAGGNRRWAAGTLALRPRSRFGDTGAEGTTAITVSAGAI
ncbi:hypothetical protein LA76x_0202 [Lysobacter antibioticus]|uniref:Uncharacterized protein n=1 Tax=Lysobacter antibioticus TaxID=84531 RepID=A0A0S2F472_LYSAN|nr:hypothetical protein LA76x_0202 [Lysobacter antibioticus]